MSDNHKDPIEYPIIRTRGPTINLQDLPPEIAETGPTDDYIKVETPTARNEKDRFLDAMSQAGGNRKKAAQLLGMSRATFYRRLTELGLNHK